VIFILTKKKKKWFPGKRKENGKLKRKGSGSLQTPSAAGFPNGVRKGGGKRGAGETDPDQIRKKGARLKKVLRKKQPPMSQQQGR